VWDGDAGHITITLMYNAGSFEGKLKHVKRTGWVYNPSMGSEWRVQTTAFGRHLSATPWIIISCAEDYGACRTRSRAPHDALTARALRLPLLACRRPPRAT
jgi:hypothetical protein